MPLQGPPGSDGTLMLPVRCLKLSLCRSLGTQSRCAAARRSSMGCAYVSGQQGTAAALISRVLCVQAWRGAAGATCLDRVGSTARQTAAVRNPALLFLRDLNCRERRQCTPPTGAAAGGPDSGAGGGRVCLVRKMHRSALMSTLLLNELKRAATPSVCPLPQAQYQPGERPSKLAVDPFLR